MRDAATVILLRPTSDAFEVFLVRRHNKSGFMAGAHVFPGGALEEQDLADELLGRVTDLTAESAAERLGEDKPTRALGLHVAAVRETFEESAVLVGCTQGIERRNEVRTWMLEQDQTFADALARLNAQLCVRPMVPFSRWVTPEVERRRFDARFFVALVPVAHDAAPDQIETTAGDWFTPQQALEAAGSGEISLPPPTLRTLEELGQSESASAVLERASQRPPPLVRPVFRDLEGTYVLALPGDPLHPESERVIHGSTRFVLEDGAFRSRDA